MNDKKVFQLQDLPIPRQDDVLEMLRQIRAVLNAHKMYPPGHQMLERIHSRFYQELQRLFQKNPFVVLLFVEDATEFNGERITRALPEKQFGTELASLFHLLNINTLIFQPDVKLRDIAQFFTKTFRHNVDVEGRLDIERLALTVPTVLINRQVIRRGVGNKIRDQMSLRELMTSMDRESLLKELGLRPDQIPPELQELFDEKDRADAEKARQGGEKSQDDLRAENANFAHYVRSGRFMLDLLNQSASSDQWPAASTATQRSTNELNKPLLDRRTGERNPVLSSTMTKDNARFTGGSLSSVQIPAIQGRTLDTKAPLQQIDWAALSQQSDISFPAQWQPEAVAASKDFQELVRSGQAQDYLQAFLSQQHKALAPSMNTKNTGSFSLTGSMTSLPAVPQIDPLLLQQQVQQALQQLHGAAQKLPDPHIQSLYQAQIAQQIQQMPPEVLGQYLVQMSDNEPFQAKLRESLLHSLQGEKLEASSEALLEQIRRAPSKEFAQGGLGVLQELIDQQVEKGVYAGLKRLITQLDSAKVDESLSVRDGLQKLFEHIADPEKIHQIVEEGSQRKGKDARELLAEIAPQALPQVIKELGSLDATPEQRNQQVELLIEIARTAAPQKREEAFSALFSKMRQGLLLDPQQDLILELSRHYVPRLFEDYLLDRLTDPLPHIERERLLNQAIAHDTPRLRSFLLKILESRALCHVPEQEEILAQYLHRSQDLDAIAWVANEIAEAQRPVGQKHAAVWMLGLFHEDKSLALLKKILLEKKKKGYAHTEDIRFQALHTLTRFPRPQILPLLKEARKDPSPLVQAHAFQLAKEITPADESLAKTLYFNEISLLNLPLPEEEEPSFLQSKAFRWLLIALAAGLTLGLLVKFVLLK